MCAEDTIVEEVIAEETGTGDDDVIGADDDLEDGLIEAAMIADNLVDEVMEDTREQSGGHLLPHKDFFITPDPNSTKFHCSICDKSINKRSKRAHERMHSGHRPYICSYCGKGFTRSNDTKRHELIHNREGALECDQCDKTFRDKFGLERHKLTHTGGSQEAYVCQTCGKNFFEESEFNVHVNRKCKDFRCKFCHKIFRDGHDLRRHVITHSDERPFECGVCNKAYRDQYNLNRHMRTHNKEIPSMCDISQRTSQDNPKGKKRKVTKMKTQYECDICDEVFSKILQLRKHKLIHVESTTGFTCRKCWKSFAKESELDIHVYLRCKEKGLKCEICGKVFRDNHDLKRHVTIHSDERPFKCDVCEKLYRDEYNLKRHMKKHYNNIVLLSVEAEERRHIKPKEIGEKQRGSKKQFKCNNCEEVFSRALHLKRHQISHHSNQTPFQCDICGKYFKEFNKLNRHTFIHKSKPSIKCDTCGKGFRDRFDLKRHVASHTRKYDHMCDVCDKGFRDSYDLKRHSRTHKRKGRCK